MTSTDSFWPFCWPQQRGLHFETHTDALTFSYCIVLNSFSGCAGRNLPSTTGDHSMSAAERCKKKVPKFQDIIHFPTAERTRTGVKIRNEMGPESLEWVYRNVFPPPTLFEWACFETCTSSTASDVFSAFTMQTDPPNSKYCRMQKNQLEKY